MEDDRPLIEKVSDAVGVYETVYLTVVTLAISLALLIMGNALARLIGAFLLSVLLFGWIRRFRASKRTTAP